MGLNNISLTNYAQNPCKNNSSIANSTNVQCASFAGETENKNKFKLPDMNRLTAYTLVIGGIANLLTLKGVKGLSDAAKGTAGKIGLIATIAALALGGGAFIQAGHDKKQPNEFLSGLIIIATALPFMKKQMLLFLGWLNIGLGLFSLGLANRTEKDKTINCPTLTKSIKFIADDFVRGVKSCKEFLKQTWQYATRERKQLPDIITSKPNADQRRVSGVLLLLGGAATVAAAVRMKVDALRAQKIAKIAAAAISLGTVGFNVGNYILNDKVNKGTSKEVTRAGLMLKQLIEILQIYSPGSFFLGYSKMLANASSYETLSALSKYSSQLTIKPIPSAKEWYTKILAKAPPSHETLLALNKYSSQPANK